MTQSAGFVRDPEITRIDKTDEFLRLMIKPNVGTGRVGRTMPKLWMQWRDMGLLHFQTARRIATVAIDAAEHDMRRLVHRLDAFVTLHAAHAFSIGLGLGLIDPVAFWR
jgi:hypothetical protein